MTLSVTAQMKNFLTNRYFRIMDSGGRPIRNCTLYPQDIDALILEIHEMAIDVFLVLEDIEEFRFSRKVRSHFKTLEFDILLFRNDGIKLEWTMTIRDTMS